VSVSHADAGAQYRAPTTRPTLLSVEPTRLPRDLTDRIAWVVWRLEPKSKKPGEWTKVPYRSTEPARKASSTDSATWSSFADAFAAYQVDPTLDGVGIVLNGDGIVGIDLDNALDAEGRPKAWAQEILDDLPGAYVERSPGGKGLRILCRGTLPPGRRKITYQDGVVEMYDDGRFLTMTGVGL
jgi:putative DNA primase/helicase